MFIIPKMTAPPEAAINSQGSGAVPTEAVRLDTANDDSFSSIFSDARSDVASFAFGHSRRTEVINTELPRKLPDVTREPLPDTAAGTLMWFFSPLPMAACSSDVPVLTPVEHNSDSIVSILEGNMKDIPSLTYTQTIDSDAETLARMPETMMGPEYYAVNPTDETAALPLFLSDTDADLASPTMPLAEPDVSQEPLNATNTPLPEDASKPAESLVPDSEIPLPMPESGNTEHIQTTQTRTPEQQVPRQIPDTPVADTQQTLTTPPKSTAPTVEPEPTVGDVSEPLPLPKSVPFTAPSVAANYSQPDNKLAVTAADPAPETETVQLTMSETVDDSTCPLENENEIPEPTVPLNKVARQSGALPHSPNPQSPEYDAPKTTMEVRDFAGTQELSNTAADMPDSDVPEISPQPKTDAVADTKSAALTENEQINPAQKDTSANTKHGNEANTGSKNEAEKDSNPPAPVARTVPERPSTTPADTQVVSRAAERTGTDARKPSAASSPDSQGTQDLTYSPQLDLRSEKLSAIQQLKTLPNSDITATRETLFDTIVEKIELTTGDTETMTIQLKPEHLGKVTIRLTMTEQGMSLKVSAEDQNVRNMIGSQINQLVETLTEKGIKISGTEVVYTGVAEHSYGQQPSSGQRESSRRDTRYGTGTLRRDAVDLDFSDITQNFWGQSLDVLDSDISSVEYRA